MSRFTKADVFGNYGEFEMINSTSVLLVARFPSLVELRIAVKHCATFIHFEGKNKCCSYIAFSLTNGVPVNLIQ